MRKEEKKIGKQITRQERTSSTMHETKEMCCIEGRNMQKRLRETQKIPVKSRSTVQFHKKKNILKERGNKANLRKKKKELKWK